MATVHAPAVVGQAIRNLLADAAPRDIFPGAQFRLCQAASLAAPPVADLGVSVYLYQVTFNPHRRNLPPRKDADGRRFKPSVPLDLHFLITAWARTPELQWALLAWAIRTIEDSQVLPAGLLNQNAGSDPTGASPLVFREDEAIELVGESLSLADMVSVWEVAKANQQPSVSFVARSVQIDSELELLTGPAVQTRVFAMTTHAS